MYIARDFTTPLECVEARFFHDKALKKGSWKMPAQIRALGLSVCTTAEDFKAARRVLSLKR